ncbi:hypothetical protein LCGC14_0142810 [marine sediment metagenome]|uniref:Uncharacterized protein n=1 Tax=marine sediment metagenome TaxID=412755 RepID=A0A0F9XIK7_9ZZZZ
MNAEQKIEKIQNEMVRIDPRDMTELELQIRDIIDGVKATTEEKSWARTNSATLGFYGD